MYLGVMVWLGRRQISDLLIVEYVFCLTRPLEVSDLVQEYQHNTFQSTYARLEDGSWIRNTSYCFGHLTSDGDTCTTHQVVVSPPATMESPGVVHTTYFDDPLFMDMDERFGKRKTHSFFESLKKH